MMMNNGGEEHACLSSGFGRVLKEVRQGSKQCRPKTIRPRRHRQPLFPSSTRLSFGTSPTATVQANATLAFNHNDTHTTSTFHTTVRRCLGGIFGWTHDRVVLVRDYDRQSVPERSVQSETLRHVFLSTTTTPQLPPTSHIQPKRHGTA